MKKGKNLARIRSWVDDHTRGTFACDREYSWDAIGGGIMFHEGIFKGVTIRHKDGNYEVTTPEVSLNGVYTTQKSVINDVLIPLTNYKYKEIK